MLRLPKEVYDSSEPVKFTVTNPDNEAFSTTIHDPSGKIATTPVTKSFDGTSTAVQIAPSNAFVPGLYTITVSDPQGDTNSQNFTWGVLALNTDKTMYHPGETGDISMAVLDDKGNMVCDAGLTLQITNTAFFLDRSIS